MLTLKSDRFMSISVQGYYNAIVSAFNQQQSLKTFFLNSAEIGFAASGNLIYRDSSILNDFKQSSYSDNITIGPLNMLSESSGAFIIDGFKKMSTLTGIEIGNIVINIKIIENTNFEPLDRRTIIDYVVFDPYSLERFIELNWGDAERFHFTNTNIPLFLRQSSLLQLILGD